MTVTLPFEIAHSIAEAAKASGKTPEEILIQTLQLHFLPLPPELKEEFDDWEQASDEDMLRVDLLIQSATP